MPSFESPVPIEIPHKNRSVEQLYQWTGILHSTYPKSSWCDLKCFEFYRLQSQVSFLVFRWDFICTPDWARHDNLHSPGQAWGKSGDAADQRANCPVLSPTHNFNQEQYWRLSVIRGSPCKNCIPLLGWIIFWICLSIDWMVRHLAIAGFSLCTSNSKWSGSNNKQDMTIPVM